MPDDLSDGLLCTVRDCRLPLKREITRVTCARGHSFDIAQSGYVNLLQPQDKRSRQPGDTAAAVAGRRRLHESGATAPLLEAIADLARTGGGDRVLDAGCGDGFYLGNLVSLSGCAGYGVDISIPAVDAAARRYPQCQWTVANADRFVPYARNSCSLVLSITGRMNAAEFRRVLRADGRLLVALAAPLDLIEIRGAGRDRVARTMKTFAQEFSLAEQRQVTASADLEADQVRGLLHAIYRPLGSEAAAAMRMTLSLDLLLFRAI